ncbi:30S ribosomal protein S20 [Fodinicurvata fenggangensis]|uniref:30S ribosomal protein S20 n=1 Tax=Fodinicurvata fenggangensis TaxID=1121830 RepID=UPI00047BCE63|nr:30S ribosomal protein S20 [Fodinicurvata fenggangensis]
MANHKSALKRIRRNTRRAQINGDRMSRIRTYIKRVETAIYSGDKQAAADAFKQAQPEIHRSVTKGVMHRNAAARKISRLSSRIKRIA